ncbi:hypothetical protein J3E07_001641 [Methanococcus voltae]|uniref:Uncharacterized protein n=1 Tax=Methanococcus voltae TaxID=2188 RepID=A0A8J7S631_METVO|nr:hypothetical protein [Methanococcus voltae]MBP2202200.1 hypothetical protein [Methanococcus voltae]
MVKKELLSKLNGPEDMIEMKMAKNIMKYTSLTMFKADLLNLKKDKKALLLKNNINEYIIAIDAEINQICKDISKYMISKNLDRMDCFGIGITVIFHKELGTIAFTVNPDYNFEL